MRCCITQRSTMQTGASPCPDQARPDQTPGQARQWPTFKLHAPHAAPCAGTTHAPLELRFVQFGTSATALARLQLLLRRRLRLRLRLTCVKFQFAAYAAAEGAARQFRWGNCSNEVLECQSTAAATAATTATTRAALPAGEGSANSCAKCNRILSVI